MVPDPLSTQVSVDALMREIEAGVRTTLRNRIVARGGPPDYRDDEVFTAVEAVLRRALERQDPDLLLPSLTEDDSQHAPLHSPAIGRWPVLR